MARGSGVSDAGYKRETFFKSSFLRRRESKYHLLKIITVRVKFVRIFPKAGGVWTPAFARVTRRSMLQKIRTQSIGVFDSGFGGLSILRGIVRELPEYDFVYLGDTARVPLSLIHI